MSTAAPQKQQQHRGTSSSTRIVDEDDSNDLSNDEPCMFLEDFTSRAADPCVHIFVEVFRHVGAEGNTNNRSDTNSTSNSGEVANSSSSATPWKLFLQLIAEPLSRPSHVHQYRVTRYSLGAAVANGWSAEEVIAELFRFAYEPRTSEQGVRIEAFIRGSIARYDRAAIVAERGRLFLRVCDASLWASLQDDAQIQSLCVAATTAGQPNYHVVKMKNTTSKEDAGAADNDAIDVHRGEKATLLSEPAPTAAAAPSDSVATDEMTNEMYEWELLDHSAGRSAAEILFVRYALPIYRTYHFWHDEHLRSIHMALRPQCKPRPYQVEAVEAALTDSGLAVRSGVIILPCGAGKTLVGVLLASVVKKPTLIVCAGSVSVEQWRNQLLEWVDLQPMHASTADGRHPQTFAATAAPSYAPSGSAATNPPPTSHEPLTDDAIRELARAPSRGRGRGGRGAARANPGAAMMMRMPTTVSHGKLIGAARVSCLTGKQKDDITEETDVVITTYTMLGVAYDHLRRRNRVGAVATGSNDDHDHEHDVDHECHLPRDRRASAQATKKRNPKEVLFERTWGLMLLDEVHMAPAAVFRESIGNVACRAVVGLTATFVREDHRMSDVLHVVGPKLFDISWEHLCRLGYLASVMCVEVHVPMSTDFMREYTSRVRIDARRKGVTDATLSSDRADVQVSDKGATATGSALPGPSSATLCFTPVLPLIAAANPNKFLCVWELVQRHAAQRAKILLFCDHILLLRQYAEIFRAPIICGETSHKERLAVFSEFQTTTHLNLICISRVGDVSVNLPNANVVIQVSSHGGSRRQEAQRLGRILRPKTMSRNGPVPGSTFASQIDAYFYSIVSKDTLEVAYASSRSQFLLDQGYTCRLLSFDALEKEPELDAGAVDAERAATKAETLSTTVTKTEELGAAATRAPPSAPQELGDTAGIKQEAMLGEVVRSGNRLSTMMIRAATSATAAAATAQLPTTATGTMSLNTVRSKSWQLRLLASMIARWEFEYRSHVTAAKQRQPNSRAAGAGARVVGQKSARSDSETGEVGASECDDEISDDEADLRSDERRANDGRELSRSSSNRAAARRSAQAIKRELLDEDVEEQAAPLQGQARRDTAQSALWQLTALGDGVVYHELLPPE